MFEEISKIMDFNKTLSNFIQLIINKRRMNYLSKKDVVGELFSISFNKEMDSQLSQDISGSILTNKP